jgi:hypothetical protein
MSHLLECMSLNGKWFLYRNDSPGTNVNQEAAIKGLPIFTKNFKQ